MGTMSGVKAVFGLSGSGVPSGINVSGTQRLGVSQSDESFADADIIYSFSATSAAAADTAILSMATGAIDIDGTSTEITRRNSGTSDFAALDFEGATLPTMVTLYAVLIERIATPVDVVTVVFQDTGLGSFSFNETDIGMIQLAFTSGHPFGGLDEMTLTFASAADSVRVTVVGKSS